MIPQFQKCPDTSKGGKSARDSAGFLPISPEGVLYSAGDPTFKVTHSYALTPEH